MGIQISLPMMAFLVFMTGFAGFVDSAAGGGGLISLPAYLFAGLPPHYTYATNKFSAACGTTFATASFFKNGAMNLKVGILAAIGSFAGSALGAHIVLMLSDEVLQMMMFIILPIAAVVILWRRNLPDENRDDGTLNLKKALLALGIGLGIGLYDGMVGPGTGTFAIIAFTSLMGFDLRTANGNAKVLNLASNYASLFTYLSSGLVVFPVGIPCAISNIVGNIIGSHFALRKGAKFIRPMMLVVLVLLLGKLIPYFCMGMFSMALCAVAAVTLFAVPFRGSVAALLLLSSVFMCSALGQGLFISVTLRGQLVAAEAGLFSGFLPALLLSGFVFDISSMPLALRVLTRLLPVSYFNTCLRTLFLTGDVWAVFLPSLAFMGLLAVVLLGLVYKNLVKRLDV